MSYSDEQLSAFLDGELEAGDMQALREAVAADEILADRLAELALTTTLIYEAYNPIAGQPLPRKVIELLEPDIAQTELPRGEHRKNRSGNGGRGILPFPMWRRMAASGRRHGAIAASIALVAGLTAGLGIDHFFANAEARQWAQVAAILDTSPSGVDHKLDGPVEIRPQFTYLNKDGNYCRFFLVRRTDSVEESIACREQGDLWQLAVTVSVPASPDNAEYRAASGGSPLDSMLDQSIATGPYDRDSESALLQNRWSK